MSTALVTTTPVAPIDIAPEAEARFIATQTEAAAAQQQARELARRIGYQLPADCTDPDLIQRDIAANMRRSVEACLEVGRGLCVLKAACPHGQFTARLEALGIEKTLAVRFMQAASRFSKVASTQLLKAVGNQSKLFELLVLDDEQVQELSDFGQIDGLTLDDVASMSVKELRAALRESRAERQAQDKLLEAKQATLDKLRMETGRFSDYTPDEKIAKLHQQIHACADTTAQVIDQQLRTLLLMLQRTGDEAGRDMVASMSAAIGHIMSAAQRLREELGLLDVSADAHLAAQARATFGGDAISDVLG